MLWLHVHYLRVWLGNKIFLIKRVVSIFVIHGHSTTHLALKLLPYNIFLSKGNQWKHGKINPKINSMEVIYNITTADMQLFTRDDYFLYPSICTVLQ